MSKRKVNACIKYIAYEEIKKYSPVFSFYDEKNDINYVYVSQKMSKFDNGNPLCIGVCINNVKKNEVATIIQTGIVKVKYFGNDIQNGESANIYLANKYNERTLNGYVTVLNREVTPYTYGGAYLIKIGKIIPKKSKLTNEIKGRIVNVLLDINNENYDLYNIYLLSTLSKNNLDDKEFSFYDIGSDLQTGLSNSLVREKFKELKKAYATNQNVDVICYSLDQYCKELYKQIPFPKISGYTKRVTAMNSSGQCIFDSDYSNLGIYDYNSKSAYKIQLNENPLNKKEFLLFATLINSPLFAYVNTNHPNSSEFLGSTFTYPIGSIYEFIQASINGVGISARYALSNNLYIYNVTLFVGITDSFNVNNGDSIIIRLSWKKI